jgi:glycerol-3-phosphate acyltransferase PlsY
MTATSGTRGVAVPFAGDPSATRGKTGDMRGAVVAGLAFAAGAIPFSNLAARRRAGVDLRDVGSGTVSGTSLYAVTDFGTLAVYGVCEVAKGAVGPLLAGPDRPVLAAFAGGLAVAGHNWSPILRGAGGRGLSPSIGALLPRAWPGSALLLSGMAIGRLAHETGLGSFVAQCALVPFLGRVRGRDAALMGICVIAPMLAKRAIGNAPPVPRTAGAYARRIVFDNDGAE